MSRLVTLAVLTACCWSLTVAAAGAAFTWQAPEAIPATTNGVAVASDGTGLLFGFAAGSGTLSVRPPDGPVGAPQNLPAGFITSLADRPQAVFAANGDALLGNYITHQIAFRPAGIATVPGAPQNLGGGYGPAALAMTPAGDALLGTDGYLNGDVHAVLRPAGALSTADVAGAQGFGPGHIYSLGVALDPQGSAVIVYQGTLSLEQSVKAPGATTWSTPVPIPNPVGVGAAQLHPSMAVAPSGDAVLSWIATSSISSPEDTVVAAARAPGGAFGAPAIVDQAPLGILNTFPAVTSTGDGLVAYSATRNNGPCTISEDYSDFGAFAVSHHSGAWSAPAPLGSSTWPARSLVRGVASAGDTIALSLELRDGGSDRCSFADNTTSLNVSSVTPAGSPAKTDGLTYATGPPDGTIAAGSISAAPTGAAFLTYKLNNAWYALAGHDPARSTTPPASTPTTTSTPAGPVATPVFKATKLVLIPAKVPNPPAVEVICPPAVGGECAVHIAFYLAFGGHATAAKKAIKFGTIDAKLRPGTHRRITVKLTAAGRRAVKSRRAQRLRVIVTTTVAGQHGGFTAYTTLAKRKH